MRKPGVRTTARWYAVRGLRRLEILLAPLLGWLAFVGIVVAGWAILLPLMLLCSPAAVVIWWRRRKTRKAWPLPARELHWINGTTPRRVIQNLETDPRFRAGILNRKSGRA